MRYLPLTIFAVVATAVAGPTASGDPAATSIENSWGDFSAAPTFDDLTTAPPVGGEPRQKPKRERKLEVEVDGSKVKFGNVEGAAGARIAPRASNLTVGVGIAPAGADIAEIVPKGLGAFDEGVDGALELKLSDGPVTPSMTVTGPLSDGGGGEKGDEVRTMFGLGYKF